MAAQLPLEQLQLIILETLDNDGNITDTRQLSLGRQDGAVAGSEHAAQMAIKAALDSLTAREMVAVTQKSHDTLVLTPEGEQMAQLGSHEFRVWQEIGPSSGADSGLDAKTLQERLGKSVASVGQSAAFKRKWIKKQGTGFVRSVGCSHVLRFEPISHSFALIQVETEPEDTVRLQLLSVKAKGSAEKPEELKQRKLVAPHKDIYFSVEKGSKFSRTIAKLETDVTAEMLQR